MRVSIFFADIVPAKNVIRTIADLGVVVVNHPAFTVKLCVMDTPTYAKISKMMKLQTRIVVPFSKQWRGTSHSALVWKAVNVTVSVKSF